MRSTVSEGRPAARQGFRRRARGFILLEALAGGVVVTIMVAVLLGQMAEGQRQVITGGRDITAKQILQRETDRLLARGYAGAAAVSATAVSDAPIYKYQITVANNSTSGLFTGMVTAYRDCVVTITYNVGKVARSQTANVRLYFGAPK
jgi:hypothetical protein